MKSDFSRSQDLHAHKDINSGADPGASGLLQGDLVVTKSALCSKCRSLALANILQCCMVLCGDGCSVLVLVTRFALILACAGLEVQPLPPKSCIRIGQMTTTCPMCASVPSPGMFLRPEVIGQTFSPSMSSVPVCAPHLHLCMKKPFRRGHRFQPAKGFDNHPHQHRQFNLVS